MGRKKWGGKMGDKRRRELQRIRNRRKYKMGRKGERGLG